MEIRVHEVQVQAPPGGWKNHEFEYESTMDLFRCIRCGRYEVTATFEDGSLQPCQPDPELIERQAKAASRPRRIRCRWTAELDDGDEPGDYLSCFLDDGHDGPHRPAVRNSYDY